MNLKFNLKKTLSFSLVVLIGIFLLGSNARAGLSDNIGDFVGSLIGLLISGIGLILVLVMKGLIIVAQYSNFLGAPAVANGWVTVRDICNMFFVIILLVIAFATILRIESYNYKKWLPKLILMAILINYSKTICGILIDATQIVMLTFVNAFKDVAGGNLIQMFGINDILTFAQKSDSVGFWAIVGSYMLGLIYIIIALIVVLAMTAMLVMRIVMIWIYVVLSPLAYLLSAFPGGQKYASQWWSEFIKNLIVGPVLAFFIWLSFVAVGSGTMADQGFSGKSNVDANSAGLGGDGGEQTAVATAATNAGTTEVFIKFIVAIGMLLGGMQITQQIGGAAAGVAGKVFSKGKGIALGAGVGALALAKRGAKNAGMAAVNQKGVRGTLDWVGSQRKGVLGQALRFTGLRSLAQSGSLALGKHKQEVEEKAKKRVAAFKKAGATRTIVEMASGSDKWASMAQRAERKEARKLALIPQEHFDNTVGVDGLSPDQQRAAEKRFNELDFSADKPSDAQILQAGKAGIDLANTPELQAYLEHNSKAAGLFNTGRDQAGRTDYVHMKDKYDNLITGPGAFGQRNVLPTTIDKHLNRTPGGSAYALKTNAIKETKSPSSSKDSEEVIRQRELISGITRSKDQNLVEQTRAKIVDWNEKEGRNNFVDNARVEQAFQEVQAENIQKKQEQDTVTTKNQQISQILGTTDEETINRTRMKINEQEAIDRDDPDALLKKKNPTKDQIIDAWKEVEEEDLNAPEGQVSRVALEEDIKDPQERELITAQNKRIADFSGITDDETVNRIRRKINEQETVNETRKAFNQVSEEKKQEEIVSTKQKQRISEVTGETDAGLLEQARLKINDLNIKSGTDNFKSDFQVREAMDQAKKDQWQQNEESKADIAGSGATSVGGFGRGKSKNIAIDFNKLTPELQADLEKQAQASTPKGSELKPGLQNVQGAFTSDKSQIKKLAASIVGIIDSEIKALKSKKSLSKKEEINLRGLEGAKQKLKDPKSIDQMQLINSGALGYTKTSAVKEAITHEEMHGRGISGSKTGEDTADYLTDKSMKAGGRKGADIREGGGQFYEELEDKMYYDKYKKPRAKNKRDDNKKPVSEVIAAGNSAVAEMTSASSAGVAANAETVTSTVNNEENTTNITNITNISKEEKEKIKQDFKGGVAKNSNDSFMAYYFRQFISSLNKVRAGLSQNKPVAPEKVKPTINIAPTEAPVKKDENNPKIDLVA